ncbi:hypothetical protein [Aliarcobacter skirrowii]|uniref:Membrane protein n=1 Tax=Aliarcobacter skirrowii CCUG 10374 TaxID=1032239 RepID=A0AAD0SL56_9BACT|nr:hypothetical protein [Aliarcobacter skirrowii]AXX84609.1 putative membrane protein [Aliarcobacter skirrowii CCUG 10374]KAB0619882.1 hypothetical protein F7P70_09475 [Aliarcobacter skirrowii CCUG 10374]RXI24707.1 hypothetical protein CP959_09730 [Aliarcobacter skirrowii CCUG 10374]SUV14775.1 Uncharacterised protein [Aliarcobacter skirrowii]
MNNERFDSIQDDYLNAKKVFDDNLEKLLSEQPTFLSTTINEVVSSASSFYTKFEAFLTNISSEHQDLSKTQINDVLTSIENILEASIKYWDTIGRLSEKVLGNKIKPQKNFLKTAQSILRTYNKNKALSIKNEFVKNNIPIEGFESKEKYKLNSTKIEWTSLIIGIIFLIISAIIIFLDSINTGMQYWLIRIFTSLGVALLITGIFKKSIQAKINIPGVVITATGGFAVFFILYFFNPAKEPEYKKSETPNNTIQNSNNSILQTGNNNTIIVNTNQKSEFIKPFLIEKELNLPLLIFFAEMNTGSGNDLQKLSYNPKYLSLDFINSINFYQEIPNKDTIKQLIELKNILKNINTKIENLNNAQKAMLTGDLTSLQSAIIDFLLVVTDSSQRAIYLYNEISKSF